MTIDANSKYLMIVFVCFLALYKKTLNYEIEAFGYVVELEENNLCFNSMWNVDWYYFCNIELLL